MGETRWWYRAEAVGGWSKVEVAGLASGLSQLTRPGRTSFRFAAVPPLTSGRRSYPSHT